MEQKFSGYHGESDCGLHYATSENQETRVLEEVVHLEETEANTKTHKKTFCKYL